LREHRIVSTGLVSVLSDSLLLLSLAGRRKEASTSLISTVNHCTDEVNES